MDSWLFNIYLFIHLGSLILGFGSVIVIDTFGLLWMFKKVPLSFVMRVAEVTQKLIWIGWGLLVVSGTNLIILKGYVDNLTKIKIFFVLMVGANGIFLHYISKMFKRVAESDKVPKRYQFRMGLATTISQLGWWGALTIGFLHNHINHVIDWPSWWLAVILGIPALILIVAGAGERILSEKGKAKGEKG